MTGKIQLIIEEKEIEHAKMHKKSAKKSVKLAEMTNMYCIFAKDGI